MGPDARSTALHLLDRALGYAQETGGLGFEYDGQYVPRIACTLKAFQMSISVPTQQSLSAKRTAEDVLASRVRALSISVEPDSKRQRRAAVSP